MLKSNQISFQLIKEIYIKITMVTQKNDKFNQTETKTEKYITETIENPRTSSVRFCLKTINQKIYTYCNDNDMTYKEFCRKLGYSDGSTAAKFFDFIKKYSDTSPLPKHLQSFFNKVVDFFRIKPSELLELQEREKINKILADENIKLKIANYTEKINVLEAIRKECEESGDMDVYIRMKKRFGF